jgi:hypothetical protein
MIIILGLIILVAAVIAGVAGVLSNSGSGHGLAHGFSVFGYHVTGSTGTLFLYGIVAGRPARIPAGGRHAAAIGERPVRPPNSCRCIRPSR